MSLQHQVQFTNYLFNQCLIMCAANSSSQLQITLRWFASCQYIDNSFSVTQQPNLGPRPPPLEVSRSPKIRHKHTHTHTHTGKTPLYQWSARRTGRYHTTHNKRKRRTSTSSARFEPAVPAIKRPQSYALDCVVTRIDVWQISHTFSAEFLYSVYTLYSHCMC